jgi:solute:Na+ symporter, SSS family
MSNIDWIILIDTLAFIIIYGIYKSKNAKNIDTYLLADKKLPWYHVGLSVMATQASAITFLSAPGQGFTDGLSFVQFYFGLPLAMIVICISFIPIYNKLKVYTAYEYLETRFNVSVRMLTAFLFLLQRGLSTGITIYAPAIILSTILHIDITYTIWANGILVLLYTFLGGTKAVSYTQVLQMIIIFSGLIIAFVVVVNMLPANISFSNALQVAGKMNKFTAIKTNFDLKDKYNIWSGLIGGFFLQLSYFGTDQSQVGRYLTGKNDRESKLGLVMNGLIKIPMQFFILLLGVMVFVFYQFNNAPLFCNTAEVDNIKQSVYAENYNALEQQYTENNAQKKVAVLELSKALNEKNTAAITTSKQQINNYIKHADSIKSAAKQVLKENNINADTNDTNYIFLTFIVNNLPKGIVGLLIAIIFLAAMGSTASGINSLASTTVIDFYKRNFNKNASEAVYLQASKVATVLWGLFCIGVAFFAHRAGNLIEAVNILGSLFYGVILGIFMVAFFMPKVNGNAVLVAAIISEVIVVAIYKADVMAFLWLNVVGCVAVMVLAFICNYFIKDNKKNMASIIEEFKP